MLFSTWRRLQNGHPVLSGRKSLGGKQRLPYRPRLETLDERTLLAGWASGLVALAPVLGSVSGLPPTGSKAARSTTPIHITVQENSSETVVDLGAAFGAVRGLQHADGLKLSILGNTNSRLVKTDLSETALTLNYARGQDGTATITVCATDADGVSVKQTLLVTVLPQRPAGTVYIAPIAGGLPR